MQRLGSPDRVAQINAMVATELASGTGTGRACQRVASLLELDCRTVYHIQAATFPWQQPPKVPNRTGRWHSHAPLEIAKPPYVGWSPTEEEIAEATAAIRAAWPDDDPRRGLAWTPPLFSQALMQ